MAKHPCKGTVLEQELAMVFTAVAQVISLGQSGAESETFKDTTLDTVGAGHTYSPTGYSEPGSAEGELFYDPALAGHQAMTDLITTPAKQNWKLKFADPAVSEQPFTGAGFGFDQDVDMDDGLKASFSIKNTGLPTFTT